MKANLSYILLTFYLFCFQLGNSQGTENKITIQNKPTIETRVLNKSVSRKFSNNTPIDTIPKIVNDSIKKDSIIKPKEVIESVIMHNAKDYTIQNAKNKTITLFNEAHVTYEDIDLKAGKIIIDYVNNTVYATGFIDSTEYVQRPVFKQGSQESEQDSILFNFKSEKALIYGVKTMQGEMITYGERTKRVNDSTIYMGKLRFTTSKKKNPDYYISTSKAKLVPGKKIIVGGSNLVVADVPTPVYLPFAYFPLTQSRTSGFIIPSWGENNQQGFFLQNGGYYFAVNDYFDLQVTGDLYSNGSWAVNADTNYNVRYKFSGNFRLRYQNLINSLLGFDDYSKATIYNISWSHNQDTKSSPNSRLSASVNLGSSRFFQQSLNEIDQNNFLTNTFNSSISFYKKFVGTPFNMNVTMTHQQNSNTQAINMTLPSLQLNMDRIYPFAGKGGVKKNALQKVGFTYSMQGEYRINTTDEEFFTQKMFQEARSGIQHKISANTNIKAFKYFTISPNINYDDVWYFDRINKRFDENETNTNGQLGAIVTDTISGFNRFNKYNIGASLSTNIYGTFNFKKGKLKAIRHTIRPSVSWSYTPDLLTQHQLKVEQSIYTPVAPLIYSPFENGIYGGPSGTLSNTIGITVNNVLEAKVASDDEDDENDKKITLLNNLNFNTGYNIAADSLRWSNVSYSLGTRLFKDKMTVNLTGSLDPYQITQEGITIDKFNPYIFRIERANLTANYSFSSKDLKKDDEKSTTAPVPPDVYSSRINPTNDLNNSRVNPNDKKDKVVTKLYKANIPWTVRFIYSSTYFNNGFSTAGIQEHTLGFDGNIELTPKWKVGYASGYDIKNGAFSYTRLNFSRDLDSWRFNFNWIPFGSRTSYNFFIGVKSTMLSDLKWDKNKPPDRLLF